MYTSRQYRTSTAARRVSIAFLSVLLLAAAPMANAVDRLGNISTRAQVLRGDQRMIAGFIIQGTTEKCVVVRARGPSMRVSGGQLPDPKLVLKAGSQTIAANDNWRSQEVSGDRFIIEDLGLAPSHNLESAVYRCLSPGAYTAIVEDATGESGLGLVEVFDAEEMTTDSNADLVAEIDSLKAQVADLKNAVANLQSLAHTRYTNAEARSAVGPHFSGNHDDLHNVTANQHHTPTSSSSTGADPRLDGVERLTVNGMDTLRFNGMNVQIVNGMGSSKDPDAINGKGNLIIGYNETNEGELRGGSHNLVVGPFHSYAGQSGVVFGWDNWIDTDFASITGGKVNMVSGNAKYGSISGGSQNLVEGSHSSINGGQSNHARDGGSTVLGGYGNKAYSIRTTVTGGNSVTCTQQDGVCGG